MASLGDSLLCKHGLPALGSVFLVFMPGGVVLASLIAICVHTGTLWPWGMVVTAPWALGLCLWLRQRVMAETGKSGSRGTTRDPRVVAGGAVLIYGYLIVGAVITGARAEAQTDSLVRLVAVHFLEHSFTYVVTLVVAGSIYLWIGQRGFMEAKTRS